MQACNKLKRAFDEGRQSMGLWQMLPGANVSRLLARAGVDWVLVDCEHGNIDGMEARLGRNYTCLGFGAGIATPMSLHELDNVPDYAC